MNKRVNENAGKLIKEGIDGRVGETRIMTNGDKATIIAYRGTNDIDILFEDDSHREGVKYYHFTKGKISPKKIEERQQDHIKQENIMNCGEKAKIVAYRKSNDIDIKFEDGTIVTTQYGAFIRGMVQKDKKKHHDKSRIGEKRKAENGQIMTIKAYRTSNDIDIQFEDGTIVEHVTYGRFKSGSIKNPSAPIKPTAKLERVGKSNRNNDGKLMTIVAYRNSVDMDVEFEDKVIRQHVQYRSFLRGEIKHPDDSRRRVKQKEDN